MSIVDRMIATNPPYGGLSPKVLNVPAQWVGFPKASASAAIVTKTQQTAGSVVAAGTQPDYARNLNVVITPTASSAGVTGGGVTAYGRDVLGSTRSETFGSLAISAAAGLLGAINFASIQSVSMLLSFLGASSSAASAFAVVVGVGPQIGLPIHVRSTNAIFGVHLGTAKQRTSAGASSSNNLYTAVTGDYYKGGLKLSNALNSGSLLQVGYMNAGHLPAAPTPV